MKLLATICARGGSKGIKNKNIRLLLGKPLISYSIEALKSWNKADRIICSTDDEKIKDIAKEFGAETPFTRPSELATDMADKLSVLKHAVDFCEEEQGITYDYIIDLDPTSPLRNVKDIKDAFEKFLKSQADVLVSVYKSHKNPYFNMIELDENNYAHLIMDIGENFASRQQAPVVYSMNASIYIYTREYLIKASKIFSGKVIIYEMPDITIDIDRILDFEFIEYILKNKLFKFDY